MERLSSPGATLEHVEMLADSTGFGDRWRSPLHASIQHDDVGFDEIGDILEHE